MSTKAFFAIIACFILLISCRDNQTQDDANTLDTNENEFSPVDRNIPREEVDNSELEVEENSNTSRSTTPNNETGDLNANESKNNNLGTSLRGQFVKKGQESDSSCACYCVDLSSNTAELCLIPGDMYINTRLQRNNDNSIDIFLVAPSPRNTQGKDIPWNQFDLNSAIANIKASSNGELELDWLGFKINGDIAVDYAILGKKTLEGTFKKK